MFLQDNSKHIIKAEESVWLETLSAKPLLELLNGSDSSLFVLTSENKEVTDPLLKQTVVSLRKEDGKDVAITNNLVGFIGQGNNQLSICSRFCKIDTTKDEQEDYFLHYLLSKVFAFNLVDFKHNMQQASFLNLLFCLFPKFLNDAMSQGIYRKYQKKSFNNDKVHGNIDISRHLKLNMPNNGRIAYDCRELSQDNDVTQLIRHTIEFIKEKSFGNSILNRQAETRSNVLALINSTSSYRKQDRVKIIAQNRKIVVHPYYTKYVMLQKLCIAILRREDFKYKKSESSFFGLIIDMAWLWEEYIATLLIKLEFKHPMNLGGSGAVCFGSKINGNFYENLEKFELRFNSIRRFPDFYWGRDTDCTIIIDAKYKNYVDADRELDRDDVNQMLAYLYGMKGKFAVILCPGNSQKEYGYTLSGWGRQNEAILMVKNIDLKDSYTDLKDCLTFMQKSEDKFISFVKNLQELR